MARNLERQLQSELNDARLVGAEYRAKGPTVSRKAVGHVGVDVLEIGVIEDVEGLGAELQADSFADLEILEHRKIKAFDARAPDGSAARIPCHSNGRRRGIEDVGVEPLIHCVWSAGVRIADLVRPRRSIGEGIEQS